MAGIDWTWCRNFDILTTNFIGNLDPIFIQFCGFVGLQEILLRRPNITHMKTKLVRLYTLFVHACLLVAILADLPLLQVVGQVIQLNLVSTKFFKLRFFECDVAFYLIIVIFNMANDS